MTHPVVGSTVDATYNVEEDAQYLFNQLKQFEYEQQKQFAQTEYDNLNSAYAASMQSPADLIYLRKVWGAVLELIDQANRPKIEVPVRNVRYSKRFE